MATPSQATSTISAPTPQEHESTHADKRVKSIDTVTPAYRKIKRKKEEDPEYLQEIKRKNNARQAKFRQRKKLKVNEDDGVVDSALSTIFIFDCD
jgi:hypothetical protein